MSSRYEKAEIPEGMEALFKEDIFSKHIEERKYLFVGLDKKPTQIKLEPEERLLPIRCPIDGCFIKRYDPRKDHESIIQECPCCGYDPRTSLDFFEGTLKREIERHQNVEKNKGILSLLTQPENPIKTSNLSNNLYSK